LQATDDVDIFYKFESDADGQELKYAMTAHKEMIRRAVKASPKHVGDRPTDKEVLIDEEQEIAEVRFFLSLVKLS